MKSKKQLEAFYNTVKCKDKMSFDCFVGAAKRFVKDIRTGKTYCSMKVSRSGMTRHFNYEPQYNAILNAVYNGKLDYKAVKVTGCGMDMHWHLQYRVCEALLTKKELEKWSINFACSSGHIL